MLETPYQFRFVQLPAGMSEVVDLETLLRELGFSKNQHGTLQLRIGALEFLAAPWWAPCDWQISFAPVLPARGKPLPHEIACPHEFLLPARGRRIDLLLLIGQYLRDEIALDRAPSALGAAATLWGEELKAQSERRRAENEFRASTTIYADREFLRLCLKRLFADERLGNESAVVDLRHDTDRLIIGGSESVLSCPASGHWPGSVRVGARDLRGATRARFHGPTVAMQMDGDMLRIEGGRVVPVIRSP